MVPLTASQHWLIFKKNLAAVAHLIYYVGLICCLWCYFTYFDDGIVLLTCDWLMTTSKYTCCEYQRHHFLGFPYKILCSGFIPFGLKMYFLTDLVKSNSAYSNRHPLSVPVPVWTVEFLNDMLHIWHIYAIHPPFMHVKYLSYMPNCWAYLFLAHVCQ